MCAATRSPSCSRTTASAAVTTSRSCSATHRRSRSRGSRSPSSARRWCRSTPATAATTRPACLPTHRPALCLPTTATRELLRQIQPDTRVEAVVDPAKYDLTRPTVPPRRRRHARHCVEHPVHLRDDRRPQGLRAAARVLDDAGAGARRRVPEHHRGRRHPHRPAVPLHRPAVERRARAGIRMPARRARPLPPQHVLVEGRRVRRHVVLLPRHDAEAAAERAGSRPSRTSCGRSARRPSRPSCTAPSRRGGACRGSKRSG